MANGSPSFKFPATPGMPLFPLSPERVNKQSPGLPLSPLHPDFATSHELSNSGFLAHSNFSDQNAALAPRTPSPSRRENPSPFAPGDIAKFSPPKHNRANSDVQGMVARFNSLDIRDRTEEMRKKDAAALKRAQMGREEAEAEVKRLREENRAQHKEIEEGQDRERRVVKRLDVVMEDLHRSKETQAHAQTLYEKEIRRARKEAFKSSSMLVKLQEELKAARISLRLLTSDLELEKVKGNKKEQEAFSARYQLIEVQEDLNKACSQIKIVEEERDALKTNLKEEEVARIAAEGRIALPPACAEEDEFSSPVKQKPQLTSSNPDKETPKFKIELDQLRMELQEQIWKQAIAEKQVEFMKMECQFGCCACRIAERNDSSFVHDGTFEAEIEQYKLVGTGVVTPPESMMLERDLMDQEAAPDHENNALIANQTSPDWVGHSEKDVSESLIFSPTTGTFHRQDENLETKDARTTSFEMFDTLMIEDQKQERSHKHDIQIHEEPEIVEVEVEQATSPREQQPAVLRPISLNLQDTRLHSSEKTLCIQPVDEHQMFQTEPTHTTPEIFDSPNSTTTATPLTSNWRTSTTTTKIPLADKPATSSTMDYSAFASPKLTREEAIEQLRIRRGRTRSVVGTPKKAGPEAYTPRRDISAPEVRHKSAQSVQNVQSVNRGRGALR